MINTVRISQFETHMLEGQSINSRDIKLRIYQVLDLSDLLS